MEDEVIAARRVTQSRKNQLDEITASDHLNFIGSKVRRIYKAVPEKVWRNDVELDDNGKYIRDIRTGINLEDLKKHIAGNT